MIAVFFSLWAGLFEAVELHATCSGAAYPLGMCM